MSLRSVHNIEDLRRIAARRLPRIAWEFLERGAEEEITLAANRAAFERIRFVPRVLTDVSRRSQKVSVFGKIYDGPFGIAPTGAAGMYCHDADVALARAARRANVPFALSTASFVPMERVIREGGGDPWFQLYMSSDRATAERLVRRALEAGYGVLVYTTDIPVAGNREFNRRNGFEIPMKIGPAQVLDGLAHPRWLTGVFLRSLLASGMPRFRNLDVNVGGRLVTTSLTAFRERRDGLDWEAFDWLRSIWPKKLVVKGIMTAADAAIAARRGADGIIVSNHGGRQLDGAPSPIEALPPIAAAVGGRVAIMVDSGIRRGSDIVKALALGADMAFVGRATLYGAAAAGEQGIQHALKILSGEVDRVMALLGVSGVDQLGREHLHFDRESALYDREPQAASVSRLRAIGRTP
ncbi:MAG: alpha-hydroxy-acid oxidizing protein [Burkholderiales bacterium]|nr:alpha-hydroxy-acid oxidizing protein [Burkholderiales bacterium]